MKPFPEELIQRCISLGSTATNNEFNSDDLTMSEEDNQQDSGSLLQLVLSVLASNQDDTLLESVRDSLLFLLCTREVEIQEDKTFPGLIYEVLDPDRRIHTNILVDSIQKNSQQQTQSSSSVWVLGLELISLLLRAEDLKPYELHSVALQSIAFDFLIASTSQGGYLFWALAVLLCTWSLEQCQAQIEQAKADGTVNRNLAARIRWKRIKSLLLETMQLYQRHGVAEFEIQPDSDEDNEEMMNDDDTPTKNAHCPTSLSLPLWVDFILPTCQPLWLYFPDSIAPPSSVFVEAISVSVVSHLALHQFTSAALGVTDNLQLGMLYQSLQQLSITLDRIWCHPWRVATHQKHLDQQPEHPRHDSLDWWSLERTTQRQSSYHEEEDDDSTSIAADDYENLDTSWNELGIAMLAYNAWYDPGRPAVYGATFEWRLWFPHVGVLMNPEHHSSNNMTLKCTAIGTSWLRDMLPMLPNHGLILSTSFSLFDLPTQTQYVSKSSSTNSKSRTLPPDNPVGTFQLLLNAIVSTATTSTSQSELPATIELFNICKALLSKYRPCYQLDILFDHLLPTCPHPGLRSKLLDMLRPLLVLLFESDNSDGDRLWTRLVAIIAEIGKYYKPHSYNGSEQEDARLLDVEDLIDQVEYFVSACTMVQLGWNMMLNHGIQPGKRTEDGLTSRAHPRSIALTRNNGNGPSLDTPLTLVQFQKALQAQLERWNDGATSASQTAPEQFFRLHLLENLLQQLLDLP
jgi:hypothetical protein